MLKQLLEVRSIKTRRIKIAAPEVRDAETGDYFRLPRPARAATNVASAVIVGSGGVDIRNINRILREPEQPAPELTTADLRPSTR